MNMMIEVTPSIPPDTQSADFKRLMDLIAVLASPEASKAAISSSAAALAEAQKKIDDANEKWAALETAEREHNERLTIEREEHASALAAAQTSFDQECAKREKALRSREAIADGVKQDAEKLMAEAKRLKFELDRRAEKMRAAAI